MPKGKGEGGESLDSVVLGARDNQNTMSSLEDGTLKSNSCEGKEKESIGGGARDIQNQILGTKNIDSK